MPQPLLAKLLISAVLFGAGAMAHAGGLAEEPDSASRFLPQRWASLSPEERQRMRRQIREHWQNMPPEERESRREKFRERWHEMSPEERRQFREAIRERRGGGNPVQQVPPSGAPEKEQSAP